MAETIPHVIERLYAPCLPDGTIRFESIQKKKRDVFITESDKKYGGVRVKAVLMEPFDDELPSGLSDAELWTQHKIARVWRNFDGSYWLDTLSLSVKETTDWCSDPERNRQLGMAVIPVTLRIA